MDFFRKSYFMPQDYEKLIEETQNRKESVWVIKPVNFIPFVWVYVGLEIELLSIFFLCSFLFLFI